MSISKPLSIFLCIALFITLIVFAFHPTMHVDESLYVGAATQFLSGDILLRDYWFDKPFMLFFSIIPGILIFGSNSLGFCFSGIVCSTIAFSHFQHTLSKNKELLTVILTALFFINPFHLSYLSSSMAEPFLLLSLCLFFKHYFSYLKNRNRESLDRAYIWFALSLCVKQSPMMIAPVFIGLFLFEEKFSLKRLIYEIKYFFSKTKYIWILALTYQLTNKTKFASITWFQKLTNQKVEYSFFEHISYWSKHFFLTQRSAPFAIIALVSLLVFTILTIKRVKSLNISPLTKEFYSINKFSDARVDLLIFILPLLLHFVGISLSNVKHIDRYLFLFNIQMYIVLIHFYSMQSIKAKRLITIALTIVLAWNLFNFTREELAPQVSKGEALMRSRYIIPEKSVLNTHFKWNLYPYYQDVFIDSCYSKKCLNSFRNNLDLQTEQFFLEREKPFYLFKILPSDILMSSMSQKTSKPIWEILKKRLRLPGDFKALEVSKVQELNTKDIFNIDTDSEKWSVIYGNKKIQLQLSLIPLMTRGKFNKKFGLETQNFFSLHIASAGIIISGQEYNVLSFLEFMLKTLSIPIELTNTSKTHSLKLEYPQIINENEFSFKALSYQKQKSMEK